MDSKSTFLATTLCTKRYNLKRVASKSSKNELKSTELDSNNNQADFSMRTASSNILFQNQKNA